MIGTRWCNAGVLESSWEPEPPTSSQEFFPLITSWMALCIESLNGSIKNNAVDISRQAKSIKDNAHIPSK
jgi:hypothetical protein